MKPSSNAKQIELVEMRAVDPADLPAYKQIDGKICCECHKQHVISGDVVVCDHQVLQHFSTRVEKVVCRRCWNQERVKAKYSAGSSPWIAKNYVTK